MANVDFDSFEKSVAVLGSAIEERKPEAIKAAKEEKQMNDAKAEAQKVLAAISKPLVLPKGISFLPKPVSKPTGVSTPVKTKPVVKAEKKEAVKHFDQFGEEFKSSTPANKEITNPIGILATPGQLTSEEFLDLIVDFDYGNDSSDSTGIITVSFEQACAKLASVLNAKDINVLGMRNHERVRACVDAYIGLPINAPLGFHLSYAMDLARSEVNPNGGWVPALTQQILNETIVRRRDYVTLLDVQAKKIGNAIGRYSNLILGEESEYREFLKAGDKLSCAFVLVNAMMYGLMLEDNVGMRFDEDIFFNLAQLAGFTVQQCGLIVKTGIDSFYDGFTSQAKDKFRKQIMLLGPMPKVKEQNDLSASMAEILKKNGLPVPTFMKQ